MVCALSQAAALLGGMRVWWWGWARKQNPEVDEGERLLSQGKGELCLVVEGAVHGSGFWCLVPLCLLV